MSLVFQKAEDLPGDVEIFPVIDVDQPGLDFSSIHFHKIFVGWNDKTPVTFFDFQHWVGWISGHI